MPATIDPVIRFLGFIGVVDVVLPFILVFTMIYAFLEKSKILGDEKHRFNAIVSVMIALFVVGSANILGLTTQIVQYLGLFTIIVLAFVLVFGLLGVEHLPQNKVWNSVFFIVFMFISVSVFRSLGWFGQDNDWFWWIFVLFFVVLFVLKIWLEQTESKDSSGKKQEKEIAGSEKNKKQGRGEHPKSVLEQFEKFSPEQKENYLKQSEELKRAVMEAEMQRRQKSEEEQ